MDFYYLFPTKDGNWLVARERDTGQTFQTKELAIEYARMTASARRPSAVIELTAKGREVARENFL
jgi:hypothetical protein